MTNDNAPLLSATHDNTSGVDLHCAVEVNIETNTDVAEIFADMNIIINKRAGRLAVGHFFLLIKHNESSESP